MVNHSWANQEENDAEWQLATKEKKEQGEECFNESNFYFRIYFSSHEVVNQMSNEQRVAQNELELVSKQAWADLAENKSSWQEVPKKKKLKP